MAPLTTWKPSGGANPIQGGCPLAQFIDPTSNPTNPSFYSTNLIRALTGYAGIGNVIDFTNSYTNNYNSLQVQLKRCSRLLSAFLLACANSLSSEGSLACGAPAGIFGTVAAGE